MTVAGDMRTSTADGPDARDAAVTVVIATYNSVDYLRVAVTSVLQQTVSAWELIIVDDGSTDGTREWLSTLSDPRIRCIFEPHGANLAYLRNLGVAGGNAPWVAILDADDSWEPHKLERQLAFHRNHPSIRWSYTGRKLMDAAGAPLSDENYRPWAPVAGWIVQEVLVFDAMIATPSMCVARSLLEEAGGFDERFRYAADHLLRIDLAMLSECGVIDEPLVRVRLHAASRTHRNGESNSALADVFSAFAARAPSAELRALSRNGEATFRVNAARIWIDAREWRRAARSLRVAMGLRPFQRSTYRIAARWLLAIVRHVCTRGSRSSQAQRTNV